jgi:hypothetical protein
VSTADITSMRSVIERLNGAARRLFPFMGRIHHHLPQLDMVMVVARVLVRLASFWPVQLDATHGVDGAAVVGDDEAGAAEPRAAKRRLVVGAARHKGV